MDANKFRPFLACPQENGLPARLVGEQDLFSWSANEEFLFETEEEGGLHEEEGLDLRSKMSGRAVHRGTRVRLTSHRLTWHAAAADNSWLAVRLDAVASAESWGSFMHRRRCQLQLHSRAAPVFVRGADDTKTDELLAKVRDALKSAAWQGGSFEVAALGGLSRILGKESSKMKATGQTLDVALADLDSLRRHAAEAAAAARQVAASLSKPAANGYSPESGDADSDVGKLLEDFGLLQADGTPIATAGGKSEADVVADVKNICMAALEKKGGLGMLLTHDVFCLVNRARGTALLSPEEVMRALRSCAGHGGPLRLRSLGGSGGAVAVSLARLDDSAFDAQLLKMVEDSPLSAFRLAAELKVTAAEARYVLQDAEGRAVLVRDDAPECVYFYRNFFDEF